MRKLSLIAATALLLAVAPAADAAKGVKYKGKITGGNKVTFSLYKGKILELVTGVPTTCLPIQGGGNPMTGSEFWNFTDIKLGKKFKWSEQSKPSFYYNEVTRNHTLTTRRAGKNKITGKIRVQYEFMISKY